MAETLTLGAFLALLIGCVALDASVLLALTGGLFCFIGYALYRRVRPARIAALLLEGLRNSRVIIAVMLLIGIMTALWRACGTIPCIVARSLEIVEPRFFSVCAFLLCCLMSVLTGSSFSSASTIGVVCMAVGRSLGAPVPLVAGAIMSGVFFGDRCSTMSSAALLVASLTKTDIYRNIRGMIATSAVPFAVTTLAYAAAGLLTGADTGAAIDLHAFDSLALTNLMLLPAALIILLSLLRVNVRTAMLASIAASAGLCLLHSGMSPAEVLRCVVFGYRADSAVLSALLDGGGIISMVNTVAIIAISSMYFGIFRATPLLDGLRRMVRRLRAHGSGFFTVFVVGLLTNAISCNQTLATMLTCELADEAVTEPDELALCLENSTILLAPLIPWSIACSFPLSALGAPLGSLVYAFFLYLVPLYNLLVPPTCAKAPPKTQNAVLTADTK